MRDHRNALPSLYASDDGREDPLAEGETSDVSLGRRESEGGVRGSSGSSHAGRSTIAPAFHAASWPPLIRASSSAPWLRRKNESCAR